ncbi:hypothetical protein D3C73_1093710 [compost metagenome]
MAAGTQLRPRLCACRQQQPRTGCVLYRPGACRVRCRPSGRAAGHAARAVRRCGLRCGIRAGGAVHRHFPRSARHRQHPAGRTGWPVPGRRQGRAHLGDGAAGIRRTAWLHRTCIRQRHAGRSQQPGGELRRGGGGRGCRAGLGRTRRPGLVRPAQSCPVAVGTGYSACRPTLFRAAAVRARSGAACAVGPALS